MSEETSEMMVTSDW